MGNAIDAIIAIIGEKAWSTIKGAIIALFGLIIATVLIKLGVVTEEESVAVATAIITTIINGLKQWVLPSKGK